MPRPFSPTDLDSPLIGLLDQTVSYSDDGQVREGVLKNVQQDGMVTIADDDGIVVAVVPVANVVT
jgi:hypothetical protein